MLRHKHEWHSDFHLSLSSEGRAKRYEELEKKKAQLKEEEKQALAKA